MRTTLSTQLSVVLTPSTDLSTGDITVQLPRQNTVLADGAGLSQASRVFADTGSMAASSTITLDLFDFSGATDALGQVFTNSKVKALHIRNRATDATAILRIGGEGTGAAWMSVNGSDTVKIADIAPGGELVLSAPSAAGYDVTDATNHLLKLANVSSTAALPYDIIIVSA
jgi:hypothetical protein